jgi:hypothetical protein
VTSAATTKTSAPAGACCSSSSRCTHRHRHTQPHHVRTRAVGGVGQGAAGGRLCVSAGRHGHAGSCGVQLWRPQQLWGWPAETSAAPAP